MLESRTFKNIFSPNCYQCESDAMPIQYTVYFYTVYIYIYIAWNPILFTVHIDQLIHIQC